MVTKKIMTSLILLFIFTINMTGKGITNNDSITLSQLYAMKDADHQQELRFNAEELSIQSHDGQEVFSTKRKVEYRINRSKSKITIKRRVISSESSILCQNKKVQEIYPDVTATLLSAVLTPNKIKSDAQNKSLTCSKASEKEGCVLVIDKLGQQPVKEDSFMGVTVSFRTALEELHYTSPDGNCFDQVKNILSRVTIDQTNKQGEKHTIQLSENITLQF